MIKVEISIGQNVAEAIIIDLDSGGVAPTRLTASTHFVGKMLSELSNVLNEKVKEKKWV